MLDGTFNDPKEVEKWIDKEIRIATKNLLQDKTRENCKFNLQCRLFKNKYNTCYLYGPTPNINDMLELAILIV